MAEATSDNKIDKFHDRLRDAMGTRSVRSFALECGISPTGYHQNLTGKAEPSRPALISIAKAAGVGIEWLVTGQGFKEVGAVQMLKLMQQVIEIIEVIFQEEGLEMPPDKKAEFIIEKAEEIFEDPSKIDSLESKIRKQIKFTFK